MGRDDAGGQLAAGSAPPSHGEEAIAAVSDDARLLSPSPSPSDDEDCDDLYGDVNIGFLPLLPPSPSPSPTSPPKTPSLGLSLSPSPSPSPSPPPRRPPAPETQPEPEPQPKGATPRHHPQRPPLPPPPPPAPRQHAPQPQRAPRHGGGAASSSTSSPPSCTALYISELHWWTTDAEVEAALALALAPHGAAAALRGLSFYADKLTGKSRGVCRADFLHPAAAASAAAALHGHAFHGRHCVASLSRPPSLPRPGDGSDSYAYAYAYADAAQALPNPIRGRGRGASNATMVRGNVGHVLGDQPALVSPPLPTVPRPSPAAPFGGVMGGGGGYGGFQSMGQYNAGIGTGMMQSAVAPQVNAAFLAAGGTAMCVPGAWHHQGMAGAFWGGQQHWNFRGCQAPWHQRRPPAQQYLQQYGNGAYGKERSMGREKSGGKNGGRSIGNVRSYQDRRQSNHNEGDWYNEHDHEERGRHRGSVLEKERDCDERDRHGGDKKRHREHTERTDLDRRARMRSRSRSLSRDGGDDDHPRRRR